MQRFKNILLVDENTPATDSALQLAQDLAEKNKAKLTVVAVGSNSFFTGVPVASDKIPDNLSEALIARTRDRLREKLASTDRYPHIESRVLPGRPFIEIIREVLRNGFDLVIKTIEQPDNYAMLFASTDLHLLRKCPCPVWLVKPGMAGLSRKILAAVDLDSAGVPNDDLLNRQIMEMSTSLACTGNSELHFVHAWVIFGEGISDQFSSNQLDEDIATWKATQKSELDKRIKLFQSGVKELLNKGCVTKALQPCFHFVEGDARDVIPQIASDRQIDLIIMGTVGRSGLSGFFMGNTAENILSRIQCSILAVKPEGFVSPVRLDK